MIGPAQPQTESECVPMLVKVFSQTQKAKNALFPDSYTLAVEGAKPPASKTSALASSVVRSNLCRW